MATPDFINYYKLLGISEAEARTTARAKIKAALTFNHPDKHPAAEKEIYTEKSAILSVGFSIFNDESALKTWRRIHDTSIWKWFRCAEAAASHTPLAEYVPAGYLQWLGNRGTWYDLKNISAWKTVQQQGPVISQQCQPKEVKVTSHLTEKGTEAQQKSAETREKEKKTANASKQFGTSKPGNAGPKMSTASGRRKTFSEPLRPCDRDYDSDYQPEREYVIITDDEVNDDEAGGPSSRTRSKTLKARTKPACHTNLEEDHVSGPAPNHSTRKRKRGNEDIDSGVRTFLPERVSRPY